MTYSTRITLSSRFRDIHGWPLGNHTFTTNVEFDDNFNIITSLPNKTQFYFERGNYIYYSMTNDLREYTTVYYYYNSGNDLNPDWDYPGLQTLTGEMVNDKISTEQYNEKINKYTELGYDETVEFLQLKRNSPFSPNIYKYNPIIWMMIPDPYGFWGMRPVRGEWPNNLHLLDPITFQGYVTHNNSDGNRWSIIRCFQHETPEKLDNRVSIFMERFFDYRMEYYKQNNINAYNL